MSAEQTPELSDPNPLIQRIVKTVEQSDPSRSFMVSVTGCAIFGCESDPRKMTLVRDWDALAWVGSANKPAPYVPPIDRLRGICEARGWSLDRDDYNDLWFITRHASPHSALTPRLKPATAESCRIQSRG